MTTQQEVSAPKYNTRFNFPFGVRREMIIVASYLEHLGMLSDEHVRNWTLTLDLQCYDSLAPKPWSTSQLTYHSPKSPNQTYTISNTRENNQDIFQCRTSATSDILDVNFTDYALWSCKTSAKVPKNFANWINHLIQTENFARPLLTELDILD